MSTGKAKQSILVVDDEQALANTLAAILKRSGYKSTAVYNAVEALAGLDGLRPDLIISDVMMPEMNGVDFAVQVCKLYPDIEILLISGHAGTQDLVEAAQSNGRTLELLAKPVAPEELLAKVAAMLDKSSSPVSAMSGARSLWPQRRNI
jgi:CheY-like chemotaxis protein